MTRIMADTVMAEATVPPNGRRTTNDFDPYQHPLGFSAKMRAWTLDSLVQTHGPDQCSPDIHCMVHRPSGHPLRHSKISLIRNFHHMGLRLCKHSVWHPDPDSVQAMMRMGNLRGRTRDQKERGMSRFWVRHNCCPDGCCGERRPTAKVAAQQVNANGQWKINWKTTQANMTTRNYTSFAFPPVA